MKIRPVGAELFHANGRTDRQDGGNSRFFFRNFAIAPKNIKTIYNHDSFNVMSKTNTFSTLPCVNLLIASNPKVQTQGQRLGKMCAKNAAAFNKQLGT
jgi:hypothetical protein